MKTAAKFFIVLMTAALAAGMTGCGDNKPDIRELQKNEGDMLVIKSFPMEAVPEIKYENGILRMSVSYDGHAYNPNSEDNQYVKMTDAEYMKIYEFCVEASEKNKFEGYKENVCDGDTYTFIYYDTEGKEHEIYSGYCYENEELQDIMYTIRKYSSNRSDIVT